MRILVIDSDPRLVELLATVLEPSGHQVRRGPLVGTGADIDIVFADLDLLNSGAIEGARIPLVICSSRASDDPSVTAAMRRWQPLLYLRKPFSMLDLPDRIRALRPQLLEARRKRQGQIESRDVSVDPSRVAARTLATLARLWVTRSSGLLFVHHDGEEQQVLLSQGGPVGEDGLALIHGALGGGAVSFEPDTVSGEGDRVGMGALVYGAAFNPTRTRFLEGHRYRALTRTRWADSVADLPLPPEAARVVAAADGATPLGELLVRLGVDPAEVSPHLHCLRRLRLIELQQPQHRTQGRPRSAAGSRASRGSSSWLRTQSDVDSSYRSVLSRSVGTRSSDARSQAVTTVTGTSTRGRGRAGLRSRAFKPRDRHAQAGGAGMVRQRLKSELKRLEGASSAIILGVPTDASREFIDRAAARMRRRYAELARDTSLDDETRDMARQIGRLVRQAHERMRSGDLLAVTDELSSFSSITSGVMSTSAQDAEKLLALGRDHIKRQDWPRAVRVLRAAKDQQLGNPGVMANLAWATWRDERKDPSARESEARDLLVLAMQFDDQNVEVWEYSARFSEETGQLDAALRAARRAKQLGASGMDTLIRRILDRQQ